MRFASLRVVLCALVVIPVLVLSLSCKPSEPPPAPRAAEPAPPDAAAADSPASRQFSAWLELFNRADRASLLAYHEKSLPFTAARGPLGDIDEELGFSRNTGGFHLRKAEESSPTRFVGLVQERDGDQFARATMEVDAAEPHAVKQLEIRAVPTPEAFQKPRLSEADAIAALRAKVDQLVADDRFSGAVLVAKNGTPVFAQAYGLADREKKIANTLDTRFRIGSMNKMFTAVATMQLVQTGKLELTDSLGSILHDYPQKHLAGKVTLNHLLGHTGGTGDIFGPEFDAHRLELKTHDDYVKLYGKRDVEFEPGTSHRYSNYGFLLLGVVIEHVTKQSYYDWVASHVFAPAGMTSSASPPEEQGGAGRSVPYMREDPAKPWTPANATLPYRGTAAGGGDSTVGDLLRFANALTDHKLLDAEHTTLLTTSKAADGTYAYDFGQRANAGVSCFGHGGGAPGMNGMLAICDSGYTVAILANMDPPAASRLADFIQNRLPAK